MIRKWISLLLAAALLCVFFSGCENEDQDDWQSGIGMEHSQQPQQPGTHESSPSNGGEETQPGETENDAAEIVDGSQTEDGTEPTREDLDVTQRMDTSYEEMLAAGVLMGLSMQYPDFQLEELCYKEKHDFSDKMESEGVYAFFQSGGESLCIHSRPISEPRKEVGVCDLQETNLGYATFDVVTLSPSDLSGYTSLMDQDLSEQINQLYLLTIMEG